MADNESEYTIRFKTEGGETPQQIADKLKETIDQINAAWAKGYEDQIAYINRIRQANEAAAASFINRARRTTNRSQKQDKISEVAPPTPVERQRDSRGRYRGPTSHEIFERQFTRAPKPVDMRGAQERFDEFHSTKSASIRKGSPLDKWQNLNKTFPGPDSPEGLKAKKEQEKKDKALRESEKTVNRFTESLKLAATIFVRLLALDKTLGGEHKTAFDRLLTGNIALGGKSNILSGRGNIAESLTRIITGKAGGGRAAAAGGEEAEAASAVIGAEALTKLTAITSILGTIAVGIGATGRAIYDVDLAGAKRGRFARGAGTTTGAVDVEDAQLARFNMSGKDTETSRATARYDVRSGAFRAYALFGVDPNQPGAQNLLAQKAQPYLKSLDQGAVAAQWENTGLGQALGGQDTMISLREGKLGAVPDFNAKAAKDRDLTDRTQSNQEDVIESTKMMSTIFETIKENIAGTDVATKAYTGVVDTATAGMEGLVESTADLSKAFTNFFDKLNAAGGVKPGGTGESAGTPLSNFFHVEPPKPGEEPTISRGTPLSDLLGITKPPGPFKPNLPDVNATPKEAVTNQDMQDITKSVTGNYDTFNPDKPGGGDYNTRPNPDFDDPATWPPGTGPFRIPGTDQSIDFPKEKKNELPLYKNWGDPSNMPDKNATPESFMKSNTEQTSNNFGELSGQIIKSSNIFIDLNKNMEEFNEKLDSAKYLVSREQASAIGGGGGAGGTATTIGPGGAPITAGGIEAGGGGFAGEGIGGGASRAPSGAGLPDVSVAAQGGGGAGAPGSIVARGSSYGTPGAARPAKGALKKNQQEAYDAFKKLGYDDNAARAAVANLSGESLANPADIHADPSRSNPNQKAHGIASWDDPRSQRIKAQFGKMPNEMSVAEQAQAMDWEQKNFYKKTYATLHDPNASAEDKLRAEIDYESPADKAGAFNARSGFLKGFKPGSAPAGGATPSAGGAAPASGGAPAMPDVSDSGDWVDHVSNMKKAGLLTDPQCVTLAMASVGIQKGSGTAGANVHDWRPGEGAMEGTLKKGTPVSTFLDRQGNESNRYAGGGSGTPGARLDHAAEFEKYLYDKSGKRTGMEVLEQYQGSKPHLKDYYDSDTGYGESNARHYHAIKTATGDYLGGSRNAMNRTQDDTKTAAQPAAKSPSHMGDMSMFQGVNKGQDISVFNKSGGNVNVQSAMLGATVGSFMS